uniref:TonB-dependent receptor n=1 Tax=Ningiella ruwaisensis TaxID=2364274 RepID=UPI00109F3A4C|nr:TonB-dependent receptor [Ningiella ruwaisensis]
MIKTKVNKSKSYFIAMSGLLILTSVSFYSSADVNAAIDENKRDYLESIEVVGRVNSFVNESEMDLGAASSPDMRAQISALPGLNVNGNGLVSGIVQYRGLFGERVRVNVDGSEVIGAGPNGMDPPLSHLVGSLYQQITLHQGIAPVSAGTETVGGAIEVNEFSFDVNLNNTWRTEGGLTGSYMHNDSRALSALVFTTGYQKYFGVSADLQEGDNYESGDSRIIPSTFYERNAVKIRAGLEQGAHRLDLLVGKRNTNESGTPALAMDILFVDSLWYRLRHEYRANDNWRISTLLFGNQNEHDMNNYTLRQAPMPAMQRLNQTEADAAGVQSKVEIDSNAGTTEIGMDYLKRTHDSNISNPNNPMFFLLNFNNVQRSRISAFFEYTRQSSDMKWQAGARVSEVSTSADAIATNMAMMNANVASLQNNFNMQTRTRDFSLFDLVAKISVPLFELPDWSFTASAGIKERAPSYNELYSWFPLGVSAGLADGRNYLGNLDLDKESANKIDLSVDYAQSNYALHASVFYNKVDDYILGTLSNNPAANMIAMMNNTLAPLQWNNTDAELSGFELRANFQLNEHWLFEGFVEYVRGKQTTPIEQDLYRLAPLNGSFNVHYSQDSWQWRLDARFAAAQNKVAEQQNERPSAGYVVLNSQIDYQVSERLSLSLIAENLLDKNYSDHLAGINRVAGTQVALGEQIPSPGLNLGAFVQYQF